MNRDDPKNLIGLEPAKGGIEYVYQALFCGSVFLFGYFLEVKLIEREQK